MPKVRYIVQPWSTNLCCILFHHCEDVQSVYTRSRPFVFCNITLRGVRKSKCEQLSDMLAENS